MIYRKIFSLMLAWILALSVSAQNDEFKVENFHPVTPSAFQFLKYSEMPVSEFRGIPDISVPLYNFDIDGFGLNLNLTYHAKGIRVSEEASWVGLGWDLQVGSIVQEINDLDDYGIGVTRKMPDYNFSAVPQYFPNKYNLGCPSTSNPSWTSPFSYQSPQPYNSYMISTNNWVPLDGINSEGNTVQDLFNSASYDSEPDIFKASFFGHSITFVLNFPNSSIRVLDKRGYIVQKTSAGFKIITPQGEEYYFEVSSTTDSYTTSSGGLFPASTSSLQTSSKTFYLTKVVTARKRTIIFNYATSLFNDNFPAYSEKWYQVTDHTSLSYQVYPCTSAPPGYLNLSSSGGIAKNFSHSSEQRVHLSEITFPDGAISFVRSSRIDLLGAQKLDQINLSVPGLTRNYVFNYGYFDASAVGGNAIIPSTMSSFGTTQAYRLKLLSLSASDGAVHSFAYDATSLPVKNSFAQDLWGYYNGQLGHANLIPNPTRMGIVGLADNGNNNSANLTYAKAGMLSSITYPTGGSVQFEYELNQFDNYWVADFSSTANTLTNGNGLRIKTISTYSDVDKLAKKVRYTYEGGRDFFSLIANRQFTVNSIVVGSGNILAVTPKTISELNGKSFFARNSLGSGSGVGYSKVVREEIDPLGITNGKTETFFNLTSDILSDPGPAAQFSIVLPPLKNRTAPENGTVSSIKVYDRTNNLIQGTTFSYNNINSEISYSARIFGYTTFLYGDNLFTYPAPWLSVPQTLIGFYPIYGRQSLLSTKDITNYDQLGNSLTKRTTYYYDGYDQLTETLEQGSNQLVQTRFDHAYDNLAGIGYTDLLNNNLLSEITEVRKYIRDLNYGNARLVEKMVKEYSTINGFVLPTKITINGSPIVNANPGISTIDFYDIYGNPLQVSSQQQTKSMIWDHQGQYVVASAENALISDIAFSSFETANKGNWTYAGNAVFGIKPPTGEKVYPLNSGNITKSGLSATNSYIVSYWSNGGHANVNSSTAIQGKTIDGWTFYSHRVVNPSSGVITLSGTSQIDELRLHPVSSMLETFVIRPSVGIASKTNAGNHITRYEYDDYGRLILVKDENRNVLNKYCYSYAGQPSGCSISVAAIWTNTGNVRCQACSTNASYNTNIQELEQIDINPNSLTYGLKQWITGSASSQCLNTCSGPGCTVQSCSGVDKKCVNGECELGVPVVVSSIRRSRSEWECTWKYCFSDGLSTYSWTTISELSCAVTSCY